MDTNWTLIFTTTEPYRAEMVKGLLEENDMEAVLMNKMDSSYHFGEIEVYVKAQDVIKAKHILSSQSETWKRF